MKKSLIYQSEGSKRCKVIEIVKDPSVLRSVLNPLALQILESLWQKEAYPLELAKNLGVDEQKVYYHIRHLQKAGLIELVSKREIKGAVAKYFTTAVPSFGFEMSFGEEDCTDLPPFAAREESKNLLSQVFKPFISDGMFQGFIVVGSPDPHGPFRAHARDGHYALYLTMALGLFCQMPEQNFIKLDTEIRAENRFRENLVLVGGPGVNMITAEFNEYLSIYLTGEAHGKAPKAIFGFELYSERTKRHYKDPAIGYILKCKNPLAPKNHLLVAAGLGRRGTLAAILALTRYTKKIMQKSETDEFGHVVRGIDIEGKGEIDNIELLE
jgi:DNA-binding transcriptional ArsR family regulator